MGVRRGRERVGVCVGDMGVVKAYVAVGLAGLAGGHGAAVMGVGDVEADGGGDGGDDDGRG